MLRHYHVLVGMPGYMPDNNDVCRTRGEAESSALYWANEYRNDWDSDTDKSYYIVTGNKHDGYEVNRRDQSDYALPTLIYITECTENDCFEDEEAEMP